MKQRIFSLLFLLIGTMSVSQPNLVYLDDTVDVCVMVEQVENGDLIEFRFYGIDSITDFQMEFWYSGGVPANVVYLNPDLSDGTNYFLNYQSYPEYFVISFFNIDVSPLVIQDGDLMWSLFIPTITSNHKLKNGEFVFVPDWSDPIQYFYEYRLGCPDPDWKFHKMLLKSNEKLGDTETEIATFRSLEDIKVFPIPSSKTVYVKTKSKGILLLMDSVGRTLLRETVDGDFQLDITTPGLYTIVFRSEQTTITRRVLIQ